MNDQNSVFSSDKVNDSRMSTTLVNEVRETATSRAYREAVASVETEKKAIAERERIWNSMESGRRTQINMLLHLMNGNKPPKRRIKSSSACKTAKVALKAYALWAKENLQVFDGGTMLQIGDLVNEWRQLAPGSIAPSHKRLDSLHRDISRKGSGNAKLWSEYIVKATEVRLITDDFGRPLPKESEEDSDEMYTKPTKKEQNSFDDIFDSVQKSHWNEDRERAERTIELAKRHQLETQQKKFLDERTRSRRETGITRAKTWSQMTIDADGFAVPVASVGGTGANNEENNDDGQPASLNDYSYSDHNERIILYIQLSKPVRAHDLNVEIKIETLKIAHRGSILLKRSWIIPVDAFADETTWYLEDGGVTLRLEVMKRLMQMYKGKRVGSKWPCVFENDPYRYNCTTYKDDKYNWTQTPTQVTVLCTVPAKGQTQLSDVNVTIRKDKLYVYVKRLGCLVEGNLNRAINVSESTWFLDAETGHISIILTKIEIGRPWQRLLAGRGDDYDPHAAYDDVMLTAPEDLDLPCFDDMSIRDKRLVLNGRRLQEAKMKNEYALIEELDQEIQDSMPESMQTDLDPSIRQDAEQLLANHDRIAAANQAKFAKKHGYQHT